MGLGFLGLSFSSAKRIVRADLYSPRSQAILLRSKWVSSVRSSLA